MGFQTVAGGDLSVAIGSQSALAGAGAAPTASGIGAVAIGGDYDGGAKASGNYTIAMGGESVASNGDLCAA